MTIYELRESAEKGATWRGHKIKWGYPIHYSNVARVVQFGVCRNCKMEVMLDTKPPPNGIEISGEAVALNCHSDPMHYCPRCGQHWITHNGDGSCVRD